MPPNGPDASGHNYEVRIPNDFEPISPDVTDPREVARLQSLRMQRYLQSERGSEVRGSWQATEFTDGHACSTGVIYGTTYDLQVPASGDAIVQKLESGRWVRVNFPTADRVANFGLQMKIQELRRAITERRPGGTGSTPDRPTTEPVSAETVRRQQDVVAVPGGMSRLVQVGETWYDVVANFNGSNEFYANRGGSTYERVTPTGGTLKALQTVISALRARSEFRSGTTTPDRPATTPVRPAPTPEVGPVTGANARERAVNTVLRLSFGEGIGFTPDRGAIDRHIAHNHIEDPANYARHITAAAENLRAAIGTRAGARGTVSVDGPRLIFTSQAGDVRLVANAQFVLRDVNPTAARSYSYVIDQGPSAGTEVRYSPNGPTSLNAAQQRQVANYDVYEIAAPGGRTMLQMYGRDGSLRQTLLGSASGGSFSPSEVRSYSGQGDVRNPRPSVIRAMSPTTVRLPSRDGAAVTTDYNLQRGTHYIPETGQPVRSYAEATDPAGRRQAQRTEYRNLLASGRTREAADLKSRLDADLNANLNSIQGWMRGLVTACRGNPKAMTEAVTGIMTFTAHIPGEWPGTVSGRDRPGQRGIDLQSPELTVFLGGGHCRDFAYLLQHLNNMAQAQYPNLRGGATIVAASHDVHASAYFIQEVPKAGGGTGYKLCKMHVIGYEEGPVVDTPEQAARQIWERDRSSFSTAYDHARSSYGGVPSGDGVVIFDPPASPTDNEAGFGYTDFSAAARYMLRPMQR